ncbi:MAG: tRNA (guanosine(37)-N1)-methyltransferase TrmD [Planctomycetes bacterium RBG_16_59_8]|nr:MAG: tRNA (guanosine(37)-N1)-methyltransferase TrmD [Planctomycetes bacterium RBG_16_59_8]
MNIDIVTLFPRAIEGFLGESIVKIAREKGLAEIALVNLRDYSTDKHHKVDDKPYGGGPGMVIMADPVFRAVEHLRATGRERSRLVLLTPQGKPYTQELARELSREEGLILLCGHYEGFDERVREGLAPMEISIGDYVLTGGEVPAMVIADSVVRLIPGVLGDDQSSENDSFSNGMLEHPHYTRPEEFRGMRVPEVLLSGHHERIASWREERSAERTRERRPDLLKSERHWGCQS